MLEIEIKAGDVVVVHAGPGEGYIPFQVVENLHPYYKIRRYDNEYQTILHKRYLHSLDEARKQGFNIHYPF